MKKGILVYVYRAGRMGPEDCDCSLGGFSSITQRAILLIESGGNLSEADAEKLGCPVLELKKRGAVTGMHLHVETTAPCPSNRHRMFGGNFVYTSDSRFPNRYPIPIHDREELTLDSFGRLPGDSRSLDDCHSDADPGL